jgi:hypothetical protein
MIKKQKSVVLKKTNQFNNLKPIFDKKHVLINDNSETDKTINLFQKKLKKMTSIRNNTTKNTTSENNNNDSSNIISRPQINFIGLLDELNKIELSKKKKTNLKY